MSCNTSGKIADLGAMSDDVVGLWDHVTFRSRKHSYSMGSGSHCNESPHRQTGSAKAKASGQAASLMRQALDEEE